MSKLDENDAFREPERAKTWKDPGCHDCPAGIFKAIIGRTDDQGQAIAPADITVECWAGPRVPINLGGRPPNEEVVFLRSEMPGDEYCYMHPEFSEDLLPEEVIHPDDDDEDDDEEDEENDEEE